jgi:hypothetical protein
MVVEPNLFLLAGPLVALVLSGIWGLRVASVLGAAAGVAMLLHHPSPLNLAGAALSGAVFGFCWWADSDKKTNWPGIALFSVSGGTGVYLNQDWIFGFGLLTAPEELVSVFAFGGALLLGFWLKRILPIRLGFKAVKVPGFRVRMPEINFPQPRFQFLNKGLGHQDFVTLLFLAAASAAIWIVRSAS